MKKNFPLGSHLGYFEGFFKYSPPKKWFIRRMRSYDFSLYTILYYI